MFLKDYSVLKKKKFNFNKQIYGNFVTSTTFDQYMTLKIIVLQSFQEKYNPYWFNYETLTKWNLWKELTSSSTVPRGNPLLLTLVSFMPCSTSSSWWIRRGIKVSCRTRFHIFIYGYSFGSFAVKIWQQLMLMGILGRCVAPESL